MDFTNPRIGATQFSIFPGFGYFVLIFARAISGSLSGDSFGFAYPQVEIGYGYVLNGMGTYLEDPRDIALRNAIHSSIGKTKPYHKPEEQPDH